MKSNIFRELLHYASYTEKKPRENIFTGSFAYLLAENKELLSVFAGEILRRYAVRYSKSRKPDIAFDSLRVFPQQSYPRRLKEIDRDKKGAVDRVDIVIRDEEKSFGILIENKIDAHISSSQSLRYSKHLGDYTTGGVLVFITKSGRDPIEGDFEYVQLRWADVYQILTRFLMRKRDEVTEFLVTNFLEYMKEEGMGAFEGFRKSEIGGALWAEYYEFHCRLVSLYSQKTENR